MSGFDSDPERVDLLREVAAELREAESDGSEQVAAIVQRVSDLYDPDEEATVQDIYLNMRYILQVREQGGLDR